jgi:hypothetical protein
MRPGRTLCALRGSVRGVRELLSITPLARAERRHDSPGLRATDPGIERAVDAAVAWLCRAQDCSTTQDGGVARHFSLVHGWGPSYPETTGYIVPTLLAVAELRRDEVLRDRARRMVDWLTAIQLPGGAFQGGTITARKPVPVTFNTGQILLGLSQAVLQFGDVYRKAMRGAADWLVSTQDPDGCWRGYPTPFAAPGEKAYETHVAWGLLEAARVEPDSAYADAALANVRWALRHQHANGWFAHCCLTDPRRPLTHTIGYVLRGVIEAYRFTGDRALLDASRRTADGVMAAMQPDGFLAGRLDHEWRPRVRWACLTGTVQIAACWLLLHRVTGEARYLSAAAAANRYVRRTVRTDGPPDTRGALKGSFPVHGAYGRYEYLNWAAKFFIDANLLERAATST